MKRSAFKVVVCATGFAVASASTAMAEDEESSEPFTFSATVTLTSDPVIRGVSQTTSDLAIAGSFDVSHESGFYGGVWASNVDFQDATNTNLEVDFYSGFKNEIESFSYDFGVIYYTYPDSGGAGYDYGEVFLVGGYDFGRAQITSAIWYSPDFFAGTGDAWYFTAGVAVPVTTWLTLDTNAGHSIANGFGDFYGVAQSYTDWNIGATATVQDFEFDVRYSDTDLSDLDCIGWGSFEHGCDDRVVFSVSKTL